MTKQIPVYARKARDSVGGTTSDEVGTQGRLLVILNAAWRKDLKTLTLFSLLDETRSP